MDYEFTPPKPEVTPKGIEPCSHGRTYSLGGIRLMDASVSAGRHHQNTFEVTPKHVVLEDEEDGGGGKKNLKGVRFNAETVPEPLPEHAQKKRLTRQEELASITRGLVDAHNKAGYGNQISSVRLEATSEHDPNLIYQGANGFLVAVVTAFAQHLPLELSPDHIWSLITYAFAKHVDENAEELRKNFVSHEGKQRIKIKTPDGFGISQSNNPDTGATPKEWENCVFAQFSKAIRGYIGDATHSALLADYSTTGPSSRAASEVVLMAAMKNYFSYGMTTCCGIPEITLLGSLEDWKSLRSRAEDLNKLMMPEFANYWMPALLPVLDQFMESYQGNVHHGFWQSMVKLRHNGMSSGYSEFISGWIQILFPHLSYNRGRRGRRGRNSEQQTPPPMRQWNEMYFSGPDPSAFPLIDSFAPCDWNYHGTTYDLEFHAGIIGVRQDSSGRLAPATGWYVVHTPAKPNEVEIETVEKEINDLYKGHKKDFEKGYGHYKDQAWYARITALRNKLEVLKFGNSGNPNHW